MNADAIKGAALFPKPDGVVIVVNDGTLFSPNANRLSVLVGTESAPVYVHEIESLKPHNELGVRISFFRKIFFRKPARFVIDLVRRGARIGRLVITIIVRRISHAGDAETKCGKIIKVLTDTRLKPVTRIPEHGCRKRHAGILLSDRRYHAR